MDYIITTDKSVALQHHGILGQKWGVRRYQNEDGSLTSLGAKRYGSYEKSLEKASNAKTKLGKDYHNWNASEKKYELERANNVKSAKGLANKFSEAYGYGNTESHAEARAERLHAKAEYETKTKNKVKAESQAFNNEQLAKYANSMKNASTGEKIVESLTGSRLFSTPVKSLSGRSSSYGKEIVLSALTMGIGNMVLDKAYKSKVNSTAKAEYKQAKSDAKKEWEDSAKKYINTDSEAYEKAADKYNDTVAEAKKKYKSARY